MILIWAATCMLLIGGIIIAATDDLKAVDEMTKAEFSADGQALEVAQAGLVDAYAWMRRQPTQPVENFEPVLDADTNETDDPSIGIVRTFEVSPGLWARYEVRKGKASEPYSDDNGNGFFDAGDSFTDEDGNGRWTPGRGTRDVTVERGLPGQGTVWYLESVGVIYRRPRNDLPLGYGPNRIIARGAMATEVRRLTINPPGAAMICALDADRVTVASRGRIRSDVASIVHKASTGVLSLVGSEIFGIRTSLPDYKSEVEDVFGVTWTELKSMADISTTDGNSLPGVIPDFSLVVVNGDVSFDDLRPLRGTGVLVVQGDLTIEDGSNSFFNGLIYVQGNFSARAPAYLRGTIIANGDVDIRGTGGDYCELEYDGDIVSRLLTKMGQYRYSKAPFIPAPKMADGRPNEMIKGRRRFGDGLINTVTGLGGSLGGSLGGTIGDTAGDLLGGLTGGGGDSGDTGDTGDDTPIATFSPSGLIDALEDYLAADPDGDGQGLMLEALDKLQQSEYRLAQNPPNIEGALNSVRQAMNKLKAAVDEGVSADAFNGELDGADGTLFPAIRDMTDQLINTSSANQGQIDDARDEWNAGVNKMNQARAKMTSGDEVGGLNRYKQAAGKFKNALDRLDGLYGLL